MTKTSAKKMHDSRNDLAIRVVAWISGALEALLFARIILRLLAARPDNPAFVLIDRLSMPFVAPLAFLNFGQPKFGAMLDLAALGTAILVPLLFYLVRILLIQMRNST